MKLSIVMPSLNQAAFLRPAVDSVLSQSGPFELQLLVVDGGSTDGSIEYLRGCNDPRISWRSEPDRGQADAVNKGLRLATGDVVGWLNSDDRYGPGALAAVAEAFAGDAGVQWLIGRCRIIDPGGREIRRGVTRYKDRCLRRYTLGRLLRENFICQMSVFWRRPFGQSVGPLDESLRYAMDYDLWLRMARAADPRILDRVLAEFRIYPVSKTGRASAAQFAEQYRVAGRYLPRGWAGCWPRLVHCGLAFRALIGSRFLRLLGR